MSEYIKRSRHISTCLECGEQIRYGRSDKKFCCEECRVRHNNAMARSSRINRRMVFKALTRNYEILEGLVERGVRSVSLLDVQGMGFSPSYVTSHIRTRKHDVYSCFDIRYTMTEGRLFSIMKIGGAVSGIF